MKKLIFFILLALTPALANAEIEVNNILNGEIVVLKTETVYSDGTVCKIVAVQVPRFNKEEVEIECFQPVVVVGGGDIYNEDNHTEDNDVYNSSTEDNLYDYSDTKQNGATVNINR